MHFHDTVNFWVLWPDWPHPFSPCQTKYFLVSFNICKFVPTCTKSGYFIDLCWRCDWLKNPVIWLTEKILAHISRTKLSHIRDFCRNTINMFSIEIKFSKNQWPNFPINSKNSVLGPFWVHFPIAWAKKLFLESSALYTTTSQRHSSTTPKFRKN